MVECLFQEQYGTNSQRGVSRRNRQSNGPARFFDGRAIERSPCRADIILRKPESEGVARWSLHRHRAYRYSPRVDEGPRSLLQARRKSRQSDWSRRGAGRGHLIMESRKWKAFLRMNGETTVNTSQDILNEFKAMVEYLRCLGVDYSMVVQVEAGQREHSHTLALEQTPPRRESGRVGD